MTAPVGAAPSMLRPGQRAVTFPPSNIEGADRTRATRLPSLLFPLLRPLLFLFRSLPWTLLETDAASFLARCQEAFVGACSYFAPLHRCAPLSPGFRGSPLAPATPAPLSEGARRETESAMTNWDMRGAFGEGAMTTAPGSGGVCVADKRGVALEPCTPYLLPVCHSRSYTPGRCAFRTRAAGGMAKMLDCLPFGSFCTSFW